MEAKDTVKSDEELIDIAETLYNFRNAMDIQGIKNSLWQLAIQQARFSFKAGRESRQDRIDLMQSMLNERGMAILDLKSLLEMAGDKIKETRQEGRKEVVEWLDNNYGDAEISIGSLLCRPDFIAQLKEWGIKEKVK